MPILLTNGRVIDPTSGRDAIADVAIDGFTIAAIGPSLPRPAGTTVIDAAGRIVCPGLIDPHVHLREPGAEHKENIESGTLAAIAGGFTTVCCMPNTSPALDSPEALALVRERARERGHCRVFPVAAATLARQGRQVCEIDLLAREGAVAFSDDGDAIASAGMMARVLRLVRDTGLAVMQHAQEPSLTTGASMHAGEISTRLGLIGWPRIAEELIVQRDVMLNRDIGCAYHVQHVSCAGTVEIIRRARAEHQPVTGEASPHHLLLTHDACEGFDTCAKMNPPLREKADVAALLEGIADGAITVLATDHAPHTADEKARDFESAPFGIVGLETALALYVKALIMPGVIDWPRLIALLTIEPARLCRLESRGLGSLAVGGPADVTVIDPDALWTITPECLRGRSRNTPFLGCAVKGRATMAIVAGEIRNADPSTSLSRT
ncbi:MAG: dihydroorotase [Phycisphaeraceae bacterium]|nr:dihydroorotase [Phycisphaeraceae bacterium]